ncbi:MAG: DMT family transporter [Chloroflexi bacterium]|nr:MAG: DMT family transporter [Chloroflexota bacterium]
MKSVAASRTQSGFLASVIYWRGYIALAIAITVGSMAAVFIRNAQAEDVPSLMIVAFRLIVASVLLTPLAWGQYRHALVTLSRKQIFYAALAGVWLALHFISMTMAFENASVLVTNVLSLSSPLWVALIEVSILGAIFGRKVWYGISVAILGGVVIALAGAQSVEFGANPLTGIGLAIFAAITHSFYLIIGRKFRAGILLIPYIWILFTAGAISMLTAIVVTKTPMVGYSANGFLWMILLTLSAQLMTHPLLNYALKYIPATVVSVAGQSVIVLSSIFAFFALGEVPNALQIPGSLLIMIGVVLVTKGQASSRFAVSTTPNFDRSKG